MAATTLPSRIRRQDYVFKDMAGDVFIGTVEGYQDLTPRSGT
jgi:hypothetical protein